MFFLCSGAAASRLFAQQGANVSIVDKQVEVGLALVSEIEACGGSACFFEADVSSATAVKAAVTATRQRLGNIDVLFNHAGTIIVKPFLDLTEDDWDRLMRINVKSVFLMTREVLPGMLDKGAGSIVTTASISGTVATPMETLYCTTKAAVLQFSRAIAAEYRDRGIRCNALCPGFIRTDHGLREIAELGRLDVDVSDEAIAAMQVRVCEPEEVAQAALFLASDEASFINGRRWLSTMASPPPRNMQATKGSADMAHNGFKVFDSDMHVQEPPDLWQRFIDPKFKDQAPLGTSNYLGDQDLIHEGAIISRFKVQAPHQRELTEWFTDHYERRKIYEDFERRNWGPETQIEAMDAEGIDVAVLFPTRGLFAHAKEYDDDEFAAAVSRAYNDWLAQFCAHAPERMYGGPWCRRNAYQQRLPRHAEQN